MLRVELHQHSCYSPDSSISYQDLLTAYEKGKFDVIAITDHDTVEGALEFKKRGDFPVIVGEEITLPGYKDVIGLFLNETVPHSLPLAETISIIKKQGGLVLVPHPYNRFKLGIGETAILENIDNIDLFEAYNAAGGNLINRNQLAVEFADKHNLVKVACSDAHFRDQIGTTVTIVNSNDANKLLTPNGLMEALEGCKYELKFNTFLQHLIKRLFYIVKMDIYRRTNY
ncbi:PHP domain-containing protein [Patescibacteria group bacterium]|nr:PHP domain-containing protein [Patescibacteria group bacterium]MBU1868442.1 PHP domain-containing protein [Patescibacteria group bacterium]